MSKPFRFIKSDKEYHQAIDTINEYIERLQAENDRLRERLQTFNKDEEIQKAKADADDTHKHSLQYLSDKELAAQKDFKNEHYKSCGNGGDYEYRIIGTGIGEVVKIKCTKCLEVKDITDDSCW